MPSDDQLLEFLSRWVVRLVSKFPGWEKDELLSESWITSKKLLESWDSRLGTWEMWLGSLLAVRVWEERYLPYFGKTRRRKATKMEPLDNHSREISCSETEKPEKPPTGDLVPPESEVVFWLQRGYSGAQAAKFMGVSEHKVGRLKRGLRRLYFR